MKILVDADACPVKKEIESIGNQYRIDVIFYIDTSHELHGYNSKIVMVDKGMDAVDIKISNDVNIGDIVVTQDYGVAAICLARQAYVIGNNGFVYTNDNIETLLHQRYISAKMRKKRRYHSKQKKRTKSNNIKFKNSLENLVKKIMQKG